MEVYPTLYVPDRAAWRAWLTDNHHTTPAIWLISYNPEAGRPSVRYLHAVEEALCIADNILAALQADPEVWGHFQRFPGAYQRIRIGYIEEMRRQPDIFHQRLEHFLRKTRQGTMFGTLE